VLIAKRKFKYPLCDFYITKEGIIMAKNRNKRKFKPIMVEATLKQYIQFLAELTQQSQNDVLKQLIYPVFEVAATFPIGTETWIECFPMISKASVHVQVYGTNRLVSNSFKLPLKIGGHVAYGDIIIDKLEEAMDAKVVENAKKISEFNKGVNKA
jgi:hypothetical protein